MNSWRLKCVLKLVTNPVYVVFMDFFFWLTGVREYQMCVIRSPAIPFDASKKPGQGVLKPCPVESRINPFYKLSKRKKT